MYARKNAPSISVDDLIGRTYLKEPNKDGTQARARVAKKLINPDIDDDIMFLVESHDDASDKILTYNQLLDRINSEHNQEADDVYWRYKDILAHEGPLTPDHPNWKGCKYNVKILWEC